MKKQDARKSKEDIEAIAEIGERLMRFPFDSFLWKQKAEKEIEFFSAQLPVAAGENRIECLRRLGFAHRAIAYWKEGEKYFKEALAERPGDRIALFGLARCYMSQGDFNEKTLELLMQVDAAIPEPITGLYDWPDNDLYLWLGRCHLELGNGKEAVEYLRKAISLNANTHGARVLLARAELALGNLEYAVMLLQNEIEDHPLNDDACLYLAAIYNALGRHAKNIVGRARWYTNETRLLERVDEIRPGGVRFTEGAKAKIDRQVSQALKQRGRWWHFWKKK